VAFFRFNRDKRGYEHFYLVEPITNRRGKTRPRVLYWYRTPPNIKVGRAPFDPEVQRALEAQNPNVVFDWRKIIDAPIPSADVEKWRERRRAERAEKAARRAAADVDAAEPADATATAEAPDAGAEDDVDEGDGVEAAATSDALAAHREAPLTTAAEPASNTSGGPNATQSRRRRRRRRGRRPDSSGAVPATAPASAPATATEPASAPAFVTPPPNPVDPSGE